MARLRQDRDVNRHFEGLLHMGAASILSILMAAVLMGCPGNQTDTGRVGTATCIACHDGRSGPDKTEFFLGVHDAIDCENCHGPGFAHVRAGGRGGVLIEGFRDAPFTETAQLCGQCHQDQLQGHGDTAHFTRQGASCNDCHDIHKQGSMTFSTPNKSPLDQQGYVRLCGDCHEQQTKDFLLSSHAALDADCATCHEMHTPRTFPVPHENNRLCQQCHASFFLGLDSIEALQAHIGDFHPVDITGAGPSNCVTCHMPPQRRQDQENGPHDHTLFTVPPIATNDMIAAGLQPLPNTCSGTMGCHDGTPGGGTRFDLQNPQDNLTLQEFYEQVGFIREPDIK